MEPPPPQPPPRRRLTSASLSGLLPHGGRIEEGGTARAAPARTGQRPARCATATAPRASRGRGPLAGPRLLASAPLFGLLPLPPDLRPHRGRIEEGGTMYSRAPGATRASPPNAPKSLPCLLNDRETAGTDAPACPLDLRVNVAKCRRMSHFFIPPLGEWRTLRVKNLTFLAKTGPFRPISFNPGVPPCHLCDIIPLHRRLHPATILCNPAVRRPQTRHDDRHEERIPRCPTA